LNYGGGSVKLHGLQICTDSYSLPDEVRLINALIIRYQLVVSLHKIKENQYRIYISSKSMLRLREIAGSYIHSSMMYKLNPKFNKDIR